MLQLEAAALALLRSAAIRQQPARYTTEQRAYSPNSAVVVLTPVTQSLVASHLAMRGDYGRRSQPVAALFRRSLRQQTIRLATEKHSCSPISAVDVYSPVTNLIAASHPVMRIDFELLPPAALRQLLPVMASDSATCQTAARLQLKLCCRHYAALHTAICTASYPAT